MLAQHAKLFLTMCNWQSVNKQLPLGQRDEYSRYQKVTTRYKNIKLSSWEKSLLEIKHNQRKSCQLHLTENVLQDILPP